MIRCYYYCCSFLIYLFLLLFGLELAVAAPRGGGPQLGKNDPPHYYEGDTTCRKMCLCYCTIVGVTT